MCAKSTVTMCWFAKTASKVHNCSQWIQGLYSLRASYCKILWSLEAARFGFRLFQSLLNLTGTWAAVLPRCLLNFRAIQPLQHSISWLRDFRRLGSKTSHCLVNRGLDSQFPGPDYIIVYWSWFNMDNHDCNIDTRPSVKVVTEWNCAMDKVILTHLFHNSLGPCGHSNIVDR